MLAEIEARGSALTSAILRVGGRSIWFRLASAAFNGSAWADTTTAHGRLMLTVLGGLAEFEHELIRARTGEGRERAEARGVKMGSKPRLTDHQQREATKRRDAGEPMREIALSYNVSHSTISRLTEA